MEIIPALSILDGKNVALYKGSLEQKETYYKSPVETARFYEREGAKKIYIADLNAKSEKRLIQKELLQQIVNSIKIPIILEDGFNTPGEIEKAFAIGISQIVLRSPDLAYLKEVIEKFGGEKVIVQLYSKRSELIENEQHVKKNADDFTDVVDYAEKLIPLGVKYVMYKDLQSEGTLIHPNFDEIDRLFLTTGDQLKIYASGGISEPKHLTLLKKIGAFGAIINKAFQERKLSMSEAEAAVAD